MIAGEGPAASELGDPRPMQAADLAGCALAIAQAFAWHEPWGAWVLPDESRREATLLGLVGADLRDRFLPHGECSTIGAACVTLWVPPPSHPGAPAFANRRDDAAYEIYGEQGETLRAGDEVVRELRPPGDHWYLDTIATSPTLMGRGLGGRLLDHDLAIRDARGESAALDTHTQVNVAFYERRGFEVVAEGKLPGEGPDLFMMVRPPRR